jgi:hypothetical protein
MSIARLSFGESHNLINFIPSNGGLQRIYFAGAWMYIQLWGPGFIDDG